MPHDSAHPTNDVVVGLYATDAAGRLVSGDSGFRALVLSGAEIPVGRAPWAAGHPDDRHHAEVQWRELAASHDRIEIVVPVSRPDGPPTPVRFIASANFDVDGSVSGYTGVAIATTMIGAENDRTGLNALLESTDDLVVVARIDGTLVHSNAAAVPYSGFAGTVLDQMPREIIGVVDAQWRGEIAMRGPDDDLHTFDVQVASDGSRLAMMARDITATVRLQAELTHQATHDALTSLPNRTLFIRKLASAIDRSRTSGSTVTVFFLDIDRLKDVNDTIGHESGDLLIAHVGKRLVSATRPDDVVARIGGDEFVILCEGLVDEHAALDLAERVRQAITGRVLLQGIEVSTGSSVGVAMLRGGSDEPVLTDAAIALMRNADTAMYHAKLRGRSRCEFYTDRMRENARERALISASLETALAENQFGLVYQPIVSPHSKRVVGAEALLRWNHPTLGTITPSSFVELAEESGMIVPIGEWVMRTAAHDLRSWIDAARVDRRFVLHVNVSPRQVDDPRFVERTVAIIREYDLQPQNIALEFDEKMLLNDLGATLRTLQSLKRLGVQLSIDDFGTGYSSLSHLRSCPADFLKLDGSFVRALGEDERDDPIVRGIIQLAHSLDMRVIGEWVTSQPQLERLRVLGCDLVQGYQLGRPVGADAFGATSLDDDGDTTRTALPD